MYAEAQRLTGQAFTDGLVNLLAQDQRRLAELWSIFPDLKHEYDAMQETVRRMNTLRDSASLHSEQDWHLLENRIVARVEEKNTTLNNVTKSHNLTLIQRLKSSTNASFGVISFGTMLRIAAVFLVGIAVGRFMPLWHNGSNAAQHQAFLLASAQNASAQKTNERAEMRMYLKDAHLLMLGVMAMNAECGLANPHTLASQRERCVELLARSSSVQARFTPAERQRMAHVMGEIESALAELADVQPASCNATQIRELQARTDDALCEVSSVLRESAMQ
ncbi:MAG: hypothetical protein EAZ92_07475 [Candidatus Kapaibacterium sp.]|nr:MAG: hypothetical protein EAZ92_07475 [Candidatus Kapabacteria bacterium]